MRLSEWRPALVLLCAVDVLVTLDGTVVTVAVPAIERDLGTAQSDLQWVVTAYTLTLGAFLLVGGRAGDLFGRRRVLVTGFVVLERRTAAPMLRLAIFRHRALTGSNLALIANAGGFGGMLFLTTLYLQQVLGFSALETGLAFVPLALSACIGGLTAPRIVAAAGPRRAAALSMVTSAAAFLLLSRTPDVGGYLTHLLPAFTVAGFSFAAAFVPLTSHGMSGVRDGEKGLASGLLQTSTHLGGAIVLSALATTATGAAVFTAGSATAFLIGATLLTLGAVTAARTLPATSRP